MKKIKIVRLTKIQKEELTNAYNSQTDKKITLEEFISNNDNRTLLVLNQIKNIVEWSDIEKMVDYVALLKLFKTEKSEIEIDNDQYKLIISSFKDSVKSKKIVGDNMELVVEVYSSFNNAD
jgi:replication-associated recombination protein RarA